MQLHQKSSVPNQDPADLLVRGVVIRRVRASEGHRYSTLSGSNLLDTPVVCEMQLRSNARAASTTLNWTICFFRYAFGECSTCCCKYGLGFAEISSTPTHIAKLDDEGEAYGVMCKAWYQIMVYATPDIPNIFCFRFVSYDTLGKTMLNFLRTFSFKAAFGLYKPCWT